MGMRIGERIQHMKRTKVVRISKRTDNNRLAIRGTQILRIHNLTTAGCRTMLLIVISKATAIELNHHRVKATIEFRQHDIGVVVRRRGADTQRLTIIPSRLIVTRRTISSLCSNIFVSLTLHKPLVSVDRCIIGNIRFKASRLVVQRVIRISSQYIISLPIVCIVEIP